MSETSKPELVTQISQRRLGLITVLFAVIFWAVAANVAYDLFSVGVNLNFIGITNIQFINANGLNTGIREQSLTEARAMIQDLAPHW